MKHTNSLSSLRKRKYNLTEEHNSISAKITELQQHEEKLRRALGVVEEQILNIRFNNK